MKETNKLVPVEHNNQRILTTAQIAQFYGTNAKHINDNFQNNKDRYIEGKHFYRLEGETLQQFKESYPQNFQDPQNEVPEIFGDPRIKFASILYLWTEKGALLLAKSLNTDKAWEACEKLVDEYFRQNEEIAALREQLAGLQQRVTTTLPPPLFPGTKEFAFEGVLAPARCPCPTPERVEMAMLQTVRQLQPCLQYGVTTALMSIYNEEIHAYRKKYQSFGLLAIAESLVERHMLLRVEIGRAYHYSIAPIAGYLE